MKKLALFKPRPARFTADIWNFCVAAWWQRSSLVRLSNAGVKQKTKTESKNVKYNRTWIVWSTGGNTKLIIKNKAFNHLGSHLRCDANKVLGNFSSAKADAYQPTGGKGYITKKRKSVRCMKPSYGVWLPHSICSWWITVNEYVRFGEFIASTERRKALKLHYSQMTRLRLIWQKRPVSCSRQSPNYSVCPHQKSCVHRKRLEPLTEVSWC